MYFRQGIDEENNLAHANVVSSSIEDEINRKLLRKRSLEVDIVDSTLAEILVASQLARVEVLAEVCIKVDSFTGSPERLSLFKVLNKDQITDALRNRLQQGDLNFS